MRYAKPFLALAAVLLCSAPVSAQISEAQLDTLRVEAVRSRGFARGAVTQLTKFIDALDRMRAVPPDTVVTPPDTVVTPPDTITPPPPPPGGDGSIYFATEWSTATGSSANALTDGSRWNGGEGNWLNSMEVVPAVAGFPAGMANVLEQRGIAQSGSWGQLDLRAGPVPLLAVGESLGMRIFWQSPMPYGSVDNLLHGFEVWDPGNDPVGINSRYSGQNWQIEIDVPASGLLFADRGPSGYGAMALTRTGVYMLEVLVDRPSAGEVGVQARLTDAVTGEVLYDVDEWPSYYDPNAGPMHQGSPWRASSVAWDHLREWRIGINGIGNVDGQVVHRWGGFALCDGWCPTYTPGEGR